MFRVTLAVLVMAGAAAPAPPAHSASTALRTGDWEAVAKGFHASFELVHNPMNAEYGAQSYGMYNLVLTSPFSCPLDPGQMFISTEGSRKYQILIGPNGAFPWHQRQKAIGWITGPKTGRAHAVYRVREGSHSCRGTLRFKFSPAHRRPVDDGNWKLSLSDGEHQDAGVMAGGRFTSVSLPNVAASCPSGSGGGGSGGMEVFIPADGRVDQTLHFNPGAITLHWRFTSARAGHGSFVATAPGCKPKAVSFQARHK